MVVRSIKVDRRHIGYLKWLLESHDGMATPTTREGTVDHVDLLIAPDFVEEMDELIDALDEEFPVERLSPPTRCPSWRTEPPWPARCCTSLLRT